MEQTPGRRGGSERDVKQRWGGAESEIKQNTSQLKVIEMDEKRKRRTEGRREGGR